MPALCGLSINVCTGLYFSRLYEYHQLKIAQQYNTSVTGPFFFKETKLNILSIVT